MKLLIITQKMDINDPILGFFHRWVEEFAKHFDFITVICLFKGEYDFPRNVTVLSLGKEEGGSRLLKTLRYIVRFYKYIWNERKNYDAIFVHMNPVYVLLGGVLWRILGKKISLWYTHKSVDLKLRIAERLVHTVFTASKESFRLSSKKVRVMGHGIDVERFTHIGGGDNNIFHIITVGRISPIKDYETLVGAAEILFQANVPVLIEIIGSAETLEQEKYLGRIKKLINERGLENIFSFVGPVPNKDLSQHLQRANIFVNMSHTGSLDKAILEAILSGVPIVTCNEAITDIMGRYKNLLMFPKGDVRSFAKKIEQIRMLGIKQKKEMVENLRNVVAKNHDLRRLIANIAKILQ